MDGPIVDYLPLLTTALALGFAVVLYRRWRRKPGATYLMWWTLGVVAYGLGAFAEALTAVNGWSEPVFRLWYITGALMGGVFLAQGTVYLLLSKKTADVLTRVLVIYLAIASVFVLLTPILFSEVDPSRLSGEVMAWQWVRLFSPFVNVYAVFWLVGGAISSAVRYSRRGVGSSRRVWGNVCIAAGALLPAVGGSFARFGRSEVLSVTLLLGLVAIWIGYRLIVGDPPPGSGRGNREAAATDQQPPSRRRISS